MCPVKFGLHGVGHILINNVKFIFIVLCHGVISIKHLD